MPLCHVTRDALLVPQVGEGTRAVPNHEALINAFVDEVLSGLLASP